MPTSYVDEVALEHWHRYAFSTQFARGKRVLDVACGVGYGTFELAKVAGSVLGIDRDLSAVSRARSQYVRPNLEFRCADAIKFGSGEHEFGLIVSFETIEHLHDPAVFLDRLQRALKPGGVLVLSTPNKSVYNKTRKASNPHHLRELSANELRELLSARFARVEFFGQRVMLGSALIPAKQGFSSESQFWSLGEAPKRLVPVDPEYVYWVALCSDYPIDSPPPSVLERQNRFNPVSSLTGGIADRDQKIAKLAEENRRLRLALDQRAIES